MTIKREIWTRNGKRYAVYTAREQGRLLSWKKVKGSKQSKQQLLNQFKETGTFSSNTIRLRRKQKSISIKLQKQNEVFDITPLGETKNTFMITSKFPIQDKKVFSTQLLLRVTWGDNPKHVTYGLPKKDAPINQQRDKAFEMARQEAISRGYITYDMKEQGISSSSGFFTDGKRAVSYQIETSYNSYARVEKWGVHNEMGKT
jgi:hypothetical protein